MDTDSHNGDRPRSPLLEIKGLTKRFPGVTALNAVDLSLAPAEIHALVGENGAGKSTLIKLLCGSYIPDVGEMRFCGAPYTPQSPLDALEAGIRVVYQEFNLLPYLSVAENLLFDCLPRRYGLLLDYRTLHKRASALLKQVGLDVDPHISVERLGIAQRQLLEIGKALSSASRLLILDEPTATLTLREIRRLFEIIRDVRASGVTVIFVSHHLNEIFDLCDTVTVLRNGRRIASLPVAATNSQEIVHLMVGHELEAALAGGRTVEEPSRGPAAIRVQDLRFRGNAHGIAFALPYGEILGIAGLVGSGRTEMLRAIFGADRRDGGEIYRDEQRVLFDHPRAAVRHGVCLLTENRKEEGLVLPMAVRVSIASLEQAALDLSGGNQQKLVIAKWLFRNAEVLMLDEPTRGIDVGAKAEIHELLRRLASAGKAILVVSSEIPELVALCDRILVLWRGRFAGELRRDEFNEARILSLACGESMAGGNISFRGGTKGRSDE